MTVDLTLGGRSFRATVTPLRHAASGADRLNIRLEPLDEGDVIECDVDVRSTAAGYSLVHKDGRVVDAAVAAAGARDGWLVQLPGVDVDVVVNGRRHSSSVEADASGEQRLTAPMPGRVLRVMVEAGTTVVAGQPLVVIEAMKMENALTAARDGVVEEVAVTEGISVEAGRLLVRIS